MNQNITRINLKQEKETILFIATLKRDGYKRIKENQQDKEIKNLLIATFEDKIINVDVRNKIYWWSLDISKIN